MVDVRSAKYRPKIVSAERAEAILIDNDFVMYRLEQRNQFACVGRQQILRLERPECFVGGSDVRVARPKVNLAEDDE